MSKKIFILLAFLVVAVMLSACTGSRTVASGWPNISVNGDRAYLSYNNQIIALNADNGSETWRFPVEPDPKVSFYAAPSLTEDGQLIIGGYDGTLYSINPSNGQQNWAFTESDGRYVASPLVTETGIFAPSSDQNLYALDFTGNELWDPFTTEEPIWAKPAADENCNCLYVASMDHIIYILDASTGDEVWRSGDLGGSIVGEPAISEDNILYVGTFAKEVIAIDLKNHDILWRYSTEDWVWAGPVIDDDTVIAGDLSGTLYAIDRTTGNMLWKIQNEGSIVGKPLVNEDLIYFTTEEGSFIGATRDGAIRWTKSIEGNLYAGPTKIGDKILVPTTNPAEIVLAFDLNGNRVWEYSLEN